VVFRYTPAPAFVTPQRQARCCGDYQRNTTGLLALLVRLVSKEPQALQWAAADLSDHLHRSDPVRLVRRGLPGGGEGWLGAQRAARIQRGVGGFVTQCGGLRVARGDAPRRRRAGAATAGSARASPGGRPPTCTAAAGRVSNNGRSWRAAA
jgi:hypothetical protein